MELRDLGLLGLPFEEQEEFNFATVVLVSEGQIEDLERLNTLLERRSFGAAFELSSRSIPEEGFLDLRFDLELDLVLSSLVLVELCALLGDRTTRSFGASLVICEFVSSSTMCFECITRGDFLDLKDEPLRRKAGLSRSCSTGNDLSGERIFLECVACKSSGSKISLDSS